MRVGGRHHLSEIGNTIASLEQQDKNKFWKENRIAHIQSTWEDIMPAEILEHTDGVYVLKKEDGKHMTVYVDSSIWAADLSAQNYMILERMEKALGEKIEDLRFIVSSAAYRKKKSREFRKRIEEQPPYIDDVERIPLSDEEVSQIRKEALVVEDERLREMLVSARIHDLETKKGLEAGKRR